MIDIGSAPGERGEPVSESHCVFCRIASGAIPALRVLESPEAIAFLDIAPLAPGHTLLIPREHYENLLDVPPEALGRIVACLPRLARAVMDVSGATGLNLLQNTGKSSGQAVFHFHIHLIPRRESDHIGYRWNMGTYAGGEEKAIQAGIISALNRH